MYCAIRHLLSDFSKTYLLTYNGLLRHVFRGVALGHCAMSPTLLRYLALRQLIGAKDRVVHHTLEQLVGLLVFDNCL